MKQAQLDLDTGHVSVMKAIQLILQETKADAES